MNIPGFSTNGLLTMHHSIADALSVDDNTDEGQPKPYGVREYKDWREMCNQLEAELTARNAKYSKVQW
jgi:hypothetical protein